MRADLNVWCRIPQSPTDAAGYTVNHLYKYDRIKTNSQMHHLNDTLISARRFARKNYAVCS